MSLRLRERPLWILAEHEVILSIRSRWTLAFAGVFAVLALGMAVSGYVLTGGTGFQDFARTSASLVQLVVMVVPLASLVIGVSSMAQEPGVAEMLYALPVPRTTVLLGKLLGLWVALVTAEALGLGLAGLVIFSQSGELGAGGYLLLLLAAAVLTAVFLALAALVAVGEARRRRAWGLALAVMVWLAAVFLVDLAALGLATLLPSTAASRLLVVEVIANPAAAARTGALLAISGEGAFGTASLTFLRVTGGAVRAGLWLASSLVLWSLVPAWLAAWRLRRQDL